MRKLRIFAAAAVLLFTIGCADKGTQSPTEPRGDIPSPLLTDGPPDYASPYCTWKPEAELRTDIRTLYRKNDWPDPNSAISKFNQVTAALAAEDLDAARLAMRSLVDFITNKFEHLTSPSPEQVVLYNQLITDLWCFVGISGEIFDLNPGDPPKVFTIPGVGGVWFPGPSPVAVGTLVTLTDISGFAPPLDTPLDQYSSYIDIQLIPAHTFTPPDLPIVVVCPTGDAPLASLLLGHDSPENGFELLPPADFSTITELTTLCGSSLRAARGTQPSGWLAHWADRAAAFLLPRALQAAPAMFFGGIGGKPTDFSPFGAVDYTLTATGGIGGKPTDFAPPNQSSAAASPSNTPPELPDDYVEGPVGTNATASQLANLTVTIKTVGGDGIANPIAGVTVTFTIGASLNYDPDSDAQICDFEGAVQDEVEVVTNAQGVAALPCLKFGTTPGFANLKAEFDPSTIGFLGDQQLQVNAVSGSELGTSLNWLIKSNAGAPAALSFVGAAPSAAEAGVDLDPAPTVRLRDALGNEAHVEGVPVTASITGGGGGVGGTTTVGTNADGVAEFADLFITGNVAGTPQTLSFAFTGITTQLTATVALSAGPATQLAITQQPSSSATAGVAFTTQPAVTLQDQFGNPVSSTADAVASLASGGEALEGTKTQAAVGGVATFDDLRIDGLAGPRTLSFTMAGITSDPSSTITVGAGAATQLAITQQPSSTARAGVAFLTQPVATLQDAFGNTVSSGANVVASISTGAGDLAGTTTKAAVGGVATFTDLRIDGLVGDPRKLRFTLGSFQSPESSIITLEAGNAASILTSIPSAAEAATYTYPGIVTADLPVSTAPRAVVKDVFGNVVGGSPVTWTAVNSTVDDAGGSPTDGSGLAQVTSWTPGVGVSTLLASVAGVSNPAMFSATSVIGDPVFMCELGEPDGSFLTVGNSRNKTDLAALKVPDPKTNIVDLFFYMSVTGQSNTFAIYGVNVNVYRTTANATSPGTTLVGSATGATVGLPGNNGQPQFQHITLTEPVLAETSGSNALWFVVSMVDPPGGRTFQVWYTSLNTNKLSAVCKTSFVKTGTNTLRAGAAVMLQN